jgi:hypothetical protein
MLEEARDENVFGHANWGGGGLAAEGGAHSVTITCMTGLGRRWEKPRVALRKSRVQITVSACPLHCRRPRPDGENIAVIFTKTLWSVLWPTVLVLVPSDLYTF